MTKVFSLIFILIAFLSNGQDTIQLEPFPHKIIAKRSDNSIKLRWAPKSPGDWWTTKDFKIDVYRAEITSGKPGQFVKIASNVGVESADLMKERLESKPNSLEAAVAFAYYGDWESFKNSSGGNQNWGNKSDELENKFMTLLYACDLDFTVAQMAGLGLEDSSTESDKSYAYRLQFANDKKYSAKHKSVMVDTSRTQLLIIDRWEEGEDHISIGWNRNRYERYYTGYFIEKSRNNIDYERLNKTPYVHVLTDDVDDLDYIIYKDSVKLNETFYYRIIGIDAFGDLSVPSVSIQLSTKDRTPPSLPVVEPIKLSKDQTSIELNWTFTESEDDLKAILINKASKATGPYELLAELDANSKHFTDNSPSILKDQYYQICVIDTANNIQCDYPKYASINDRIPPSPPVNIEGTIDSNGVVTLHWDLGKEMDLFGYKIHVSNSINRPFTCITPKIHQDTTWSDTLDLSSLTEYIFYKVSAFDLRQNASSFSKTIRLKKPDLIPPTASIFKSYEVLKDSVIINFALSKDADVDLHQLWKKSDQDFALITTLNSNQNTFVDVEIEFDTEYTYKIISIDDDGNSTKSPNDLSIVSRKAPKSEVILSGEKVDGGFMLKWKSDVKNVEKVRIYRDFKSKMITYDWVKETNQFLDTKLTTTSYKVKIYFNDGTTSKLSNLVNNQVN